MSERCDAAQASNPQEEEGAEEEGCDDIAQHLDGSNDLFPEDELVTWLQYRFDDSFESGYCSEIFRHWPSFATPSTTSYCLQEAGYGAVPHGGQASSSMVGASSMVGTAAKSSGKVEGAAESLTRSNSADAALALGAGRAAGRISQTGVEAFSKVRTSLQPPAPKSDSPALGVAKTGLAPFPAPAPRNLLHKSPSFPAGTSTLPPRSRTFSSHGSNLSFQQAYKFGKDSNSFELSRPGTVFASKNFVSKQCLEIPVVGGSSSTNHSLPKSSTTALGAERLQSSNASVYRSKEEDTLGILVRTEQTSAKSSSDAIDSAADRTWSDSLERSRMFGVSRPLFEKKTDGLDMHSGGSQTSESFKDSLLSAKRKLEDSECQSASAEGESAETKSNQARTSSSKRSRAAETHNLSERRRRDRINEKMKALQDLIPNCNKADKASVLDEAIDYLKMLQLQLQMMSIRSGVSLSPTVLPHGLPHMHIPQLSQLHPLGMGMTGGVSGTGAEMGPSSDLGMGMLEGASGAGAEAGMVMNMDFRMGMTTGASETGEGKARHIGLGMGMNGGCPGTADAETGSNIGSGMVDMTGNAPARPLRASSALSAPMNHVLRPSAPTVYTSSSHSQASITTESLPVYFLHSQFQDPSQSIPLVNMDNYNTYLQQQQQFQQFQHQQLQQLHHNHHHDQQQQQQQQSGNHSQK